MELQANVTSKVTEIQSTSEEYNSAFQKSTNEVYVYYLNLPGSLPPHLSAANQGGVDTIEDTYEAYEGIFYHRGHDLSLAQRMFKNESYFALFKNDSYFSPFRVRLSELNRDRTQRLRKLDFAMNMHRLSFVNEVDTKLFLALYKMKQKTYNKTECGVFV